MSIAIPAEDPRQMPNRVVVDPSTITDNVRAIRSHLGEQTALMAVVKADGYAHGMLESARAALEGGATWLGVAHPASALALSRAGIEASILTWLWDPHTAPEILTDLVSAGIDVSVGSAQMLRLLSQAAKSVDARARVHVKIDTGMGRGGVGPASLDTVAQSLLEDESVNLVGAWTHLSSADDSTDPATDQQVELFDRCVAQMEEITGPVPLQHIANTAATLARRDLHRDIVRVGIGIYGYPPVPTELDLRPAMSLTSRLAMVKSVPAGQTIGYGHTMSTAEPTKLGLVPVGYADGLLRAASGRCRVLINTRDGYRSAPQVGRISMDQIVVDLGADTDAAPGDEVIIFGPSYGAPTAADWAEAAGTIPYEILTSVAGLVPREVLS